LLFACFVQAGWKRSKSKLTKALCEVKAATNEKVLRPMVEELKKAGNVEELLSAAVAELELGQLRHQNVAFLLRQTDQ